MGAHLGFSPAQTREMSFQDFNIIVEGVSNLRSGKQEAEAMTVEELAKLGIK